MSDEESKTETDKGLMETLLGDAATKSASLELSDEHPSRVSFESHNAGDVSLSLAYAQIDGIHFSGGSQIRILSADRRISLVGFELQEVYDALHAQRALRIIEQESEDWDEQGPGVATVDDISWEGFE